MKLKYLGRLADPPDQRLYLVEAGGTLLLATLSPGGELSLVQVAWDRLVESAVLRAVREALAPRPEKVTRLRNGEPPDDMPPETA